MKKRQLYIPVDSKYLECMQHAFIEFMIEIFAGYWAPGAFARMENRLKLNHDVNFEEFKKIKKLNFVHPLDVYLNGTNTELILIKKKIDDFVKYDPLEEILFLKVEDENNFCIIPPPPGIN